MATRTRGLLLVAVTAVGWGLNWPALRFLLREWPPLFSRGVAGVTAAILLFALAAARGESLSVPRGARGALGFAAFTNVFAWMGFSTMALRNLPVSKGALLVYTMPIWALVLAVPILGRRPTTRDVSALVVGVSGIVVLFAGHGSLTGADTGKGVVLALAAAVLFALGGVMTRRPLPMAPIAQVAWQLALGCVPMVALGWCFERPHLAGLTGRGGTVLLYMTIGPMGICYLTWFAALKRLPPTQAAMGTLMVPMVGSIAAALALGEPLGAREVVAASLTIAGVVMAQSGLRRPATKVTNAPGADGRWRTSPNP